jgi:predicted AlkP superfamily pyrophosphatase or phosphodiesterase
MLPAPKSDRISLADVLSSCLSAISGSDNRLQLPPVSSAVVVLADGLGAAALRAAAGHARTMAPLLSASSTIDSGFPTTTAAAIATLTTGVPPGQNGMVGYSVFDQAGDRVINQLTGWDAGLNPHDWQPMPTQFELAAEAGVAAFAIGPERYRDTGFSRAVLRGAQYVEAESIADRVDECLALLAKGGSNKLVYLYVPELDKISHSAGVASRRWATQLELLDASVRTLSEGLGRSHGFLLTADHGVIDVPRHSHILFDSDPALLDGIRFIAGEPRCLQLHFAPEASESVRNRTIAAWRESEAERAWVVTRDEAIAAGWFGEVRSEVVPRIGELIVAARKRIAYYDSRSASSRSTAMIGQHGSWSAEEVQVPLLRFGAFA